MPRKKTEEPLDPRERFSLYRLCECPECEGHGKGTYPMQIARWEVEYGETAALSGKCPECRGEGRTRQEVATCETPEAVGVALVTLAREGEWQDAGGKPCAFGLLDRTPDCERCEGSGYSPYDTEAEDGRCPECAGTGIKPTGTWPVSPWPQTARTLSAAGRLLRSAQD